MRRVDLDDYLNHVKTFFSKKTGNEGEFNWNKWGVRNDYVYKPRQTDRQKGTPEVSTRPLWVILT